VTPPLAIDRRQVLKLGGAASIALLASASTAPVVAVPRGTASSTIVLADHRYAESVIFAASLKRQGARVVELASDRARTWLDAVEPLLPAGLRFLAGLTLESDLFVLERLAAQSGARKCYVGMHDWRCREGSAHRLSATIDLDGSRHWQGALGGKSWGSARSNGDGKADGEEARSQLSNARGERPALLCLLADALDGLACERR
jgi:hypothetical protein